jgi:hypothetical protein
MELETLFIIVFTIPYPESDDSRPPLKPVSLTCLLIRFIGLWRWYINITIAVLDIVLSYI